MNRFRTTLLFAAAIVCLAGGVLLLTPATRLFGQEKQPDVKKRGPLDLGPVNLDKFNKADLAVPGKDVKTTQVGLKATISGQTAKDEKLSVFVGVCPLNSADVKDTFFVQKLAKLDGEKFRAECQFGEGDLGKGEYFAVIGFTAKADSVVDGDQLDIAALQKTATSYSAVLIVKRKN